MGMIGGRIFARRKHQGGPGSREGRRRARRGGPRLAAAIAGFEARHPRAVAAVNDVCTRLAQIGI